MALVDDLIAKRDALVLALASTPSRPDYAIDGQSVSGNAYAQSLLDQITKLNEIIALQQGPVMIETQGTM